jgi:hypothetical protein
MAKKKKKKKEINHLTDEVPFVGVVPVYKNGEAIPQPILQETSRLTQDVRVPDGARQAINGNVYVINSGFCEIVNDTQYDVGTTLWTYTTDRDSLLKYINAISLTRTNGAMNWCYVEIIIGTYVYTYYFWGTASDNPVTGKDIQVPFDDGIFIPANTFIEFYIRRQCSNVTHRHALHLTMVDISQ